MKKNLAKKFVSLALTATFIMSSAVMTSAAGGIATGAAIEGDTAVESGIIDVVAPTAADLTTYINPLELKDAGSQIRTKDFVFANKSNVDVKVNVAFKIKAIATDVAILSDLRKVNDFDGKGDETVTTKQIYMKLVPATSFQMASVASDAAQLTVETASGSAAVYAGLTVASGDTVKAATGGAVIAENTATSAANADFYLKKANIAAANNGAFAGTDTGAGVKGLAVMRLKGVVNPFATYAASEIKMEAVIKVTGIKEANYNAYDGLGATRDALGANVKAIADAVSVSPEPTITPSATSIAKTTTGTLVFTYSNGTGDSAGTTVQSLTMTGVTGNFLTWPTTSVVHDTNNKTITITNACIKSSGFTAGNNKTVTLTFANDKTATCVISVTAS